jgi:hypothetical protein
LSDQRNGFGLDKDRRVAGRRLAVALRGPLAASFLLAFLPIVWSAAGVAGALIYAQLPAYMLHQLEEHRDDRFRGFVSARIGGGRELLSPGLTFGINLFAVWVLFIAAFLLAYYVDPGLGLIAVYTTGLNAVVHLLAAAAGRGYNPGLITAAVLFVPLTVWAGLEVGSSYDVSGAVQLLALGVAIGGHLAIITIVAFRLRARLGPAPVG